MAPARNATIGTVRVVAQSSQLCITGERAMKFLLPAFGIAILAAGIPAYPHHSFAAHYFEEQSITVQGVLVEFEYKSPHAWVYLEVKDEAGQVQRISAEWANPSRLQQQR